MIMNAKYRKGQKVLIEKAFVIENNTGVMKTLEVPREALIVSVQPTPSMGPSYKIEWVDKDLPKPKIRYWEDDILSACD